MAADFSRVRLNPLLDYAGVELKQGGVLLDADANELVDDRRPAPARAGQRRAGPRHGVLDHARRLQARRLGRVAHDRQGAALCRRPARREPRRRLARSRQARCSIRLMAERQFADPIPYAAQPYLPNPPALPTAGRHLVYLDVWDREVTLPRAARPGRKRGRRRHHLARPDGLAGARARRRCRPATTCASPDADFPGWVDTHRALDRRADHRHLRGRPGRRSLRAAADRRLSRAREPALPRRDPRSRPARRHRHLQVVARERQRRQPRRQHGVGRRAGTGDARPRRRAVASRPATGSRSLDDVREFSQASGEMRKVTVVEATRRHAVHAAAAGRHAAAAASRTAPSRPRATCASAAGTSTARCSAPMPAARRCRSRISTRRLDRRHRRAGRGHDAAAGERRHRVASLRPAPRASSAGDYWVFAARTADASVELLDRAPPRGIHHHYARLGIWDVGARHSHRLPASLAAGRRRPRLQLHGLRHRRDRMPSGQFTIQDAVNQVRETGGTVCLGAGQFPLREPVRMTNGRSVRIQGQGPNSLRDQPRRCVRGGELYRGRHRESGGAFARSKLGHHRGHDDRTFTPPTGDRGAQH